MRVLLKSNKTYLIFFYIFHGISYLNFKIFFALRIFYEVLIQIEQASSFLLIRYIYSRNERI